MTFNNILRRLAVVLSVLTVTLGLNAQNLTVTGTVVDEQDLPLAGASVIVAGTNTGEITDLDGKFSIKVKKGTKLVISYIGYKEQELMAIGQNNVTIKLQPDSQLLDEIVVVGYGAVKRSDLTGSVASVTSDAIEGYQTSSVIGALSGQIAGVQITQSDGTPGSGFSVNIRGVGTLSGDNSPLYIVDGFQVDNIDFLSEADIESIEVLKDASSSAIYGSRAANGVVMVSTKSGKTGRPVVTYNGSATYRIIPKELPVLDAYEFVKIQGEINNSYTGAYYKENTATDTYRYNSLEDYRNVESVNWQSLTFRPTWSQDHNVTVTGGTDQTKYSMLFSHYDEDGIFINSGFTKTNAKVRFTQKLWKNVTFDGTVNYSRTSKRGAGTTADNGRFNTLAQIISARPTGGLKMTNDELINSPIDLEMLETGESLAQVNPIHQNQNVTNTKKTDQWMGNVSLTWEIVKGLTFKTAATYNTAFTRNDIFYKNGSKEAYRNGESPYGSSQYTKELRWVNYNQLTWKQKIGKHSYDIMLGEEASQKKQEYVYGQAMGFPTDALGNDNLGIGAIPSAVRTYAASNSLLSFFARANYNYNDRYLITGTIRADGSTVFSQNHKWGFFPSFSAAWRINKEKFMKNARHVSNLKLRAGWGTVGNDRIANFLSLDLYTNEKYGPDNKLTTVFTPKQLQNMDLKWEGSSTVNVGMDFGFFKDRLTFTIDLFNKDTKDLLILQQLAHSTGFATQMRNVGKIRNQGLEFSLMSTNIDKKNFLWQTNFNISFIRNTLVELADGAQYYEARSGFDSNFTAFDYRAIVGESLGLIYGYEFDGIYQSDDFNVNPDGTLSLKPGVVDNTLYTGGVEPGVVKYKDVNGDGKVTTDDRTVIGKTLPLFYGGITNSFSFYGVDFSFMFQFNYGNDIYNATRLYATQTRSGRRNFLAEVADRWSPTNASNTVPKADGYITNDVYSRFVEDGSFLRLKNMTLGYTFPRKWTEQAKISKLRIYASAQNLFCISSYSGYDPEVSTAASNPMTPGLDWGAYPRSRVFTVGLDLQF